MTVSLPLVDKIIRSSNKDVEIRSISATFGDGYGQRAARGVAALRDSWAITWQGLTLVELQSLQSFFFEQGSWGVIDFTPPYEILSKSFRSTSPLTCSFDGLKHWSASITLKETTKFPVLTYKSIRIPIGATVEVLVDKTTPLPTDVIQVTVNTTVVLPNTLFNYNITTNGGITSGEVNNKLTGTGTIGNDGSCVFNVNTTAAGIGDTFKVSVEFLDATNPLSGESPLITITAATLQEPVISPTPQIYLKFNNVGSSTYINDGTLSTTMTPSGSVQQVNKQGLLTIDPERFANDLLCGDGCLTPQGYLTLSNYASLPSIVSSDFEIGFRVSRVPTVTFLGDYTYLLTTSADILPYNSSGAFWVDISPSSPYYLRLVFGDASTNRVDIESNISLAGSGFATIKIVRQGTTVSFYEDGILKDTITNASIGTIRPIDALKVSLNTSYFYLDYLYLLI